MSRDLPHTSTTGTTAAAAVATVCTNCCSDDRWILHCVRLRGVYRKLCTSCVLKLHPTSFCPTCFSLHDPIIPPSSTAIANSSKTLTCFKCSSISHSGCVPPNAPRSPYLCFLCSNPSFKFFDFRKPTTKVPEAGQKAPEGEKKPSQVLDERAARLLMAAARIASISMNRAATTARAEAEKKVREAALARKRAKEAIDYVTALSARVVAVGGIKRREVEVSAPAKIQGPSSVGSKCTTMVPVRLEKNGGIGRVNNVAVSVGAASVNPPEIKNVDPSNSSNGPVASGALNLPSNNNGGNNHVGVGKDGTLPQVK